VDDTLKIHCRVWIENEVKEKTGNGVNADNVEEKEQCLKRYEELLQSSDFADVALNTGTKTFMAHKNVLSCKLILNIL
jgi:hypothetical protein